MMIDFFSLLRCLPPETAHHLALHLMRFAPQANLNICHDKIFTQNIAGLKCSNPIGLAAGFDKDGIAGMDSFRLGFGFIELGTVTPLPQDGNPRPRLYRLNQQRAIINRMGFNNQGCEPLAVKLQKFQAQKSHQHQKAVIGVNIGKNKDGTLEDYLTAFQQCAPFADYVTINISSPNTKGLRDLQHADVMKRLLFQLKNYREKESLTCPIFVKLAPDLDHDQIKPLALALCDADGAILTNTTISRYQLQGKHIHQAGGLSGAPLFEHSTDILRRFAAIIAGKIPLIGVGGVGNAQQAYQKIRAGASLVQLYTGLAYGHHRLIEEILADMKDLLARDGFSHIGEAIGKDI